MFAEAGAGFGLAKPALMRALSEGESFDIFKLRVKIPWLEPMAMIWAISKLLMMGVWKLKQSWGGAVCERNFKQPILAPTLVRLLGKDPPFDCRILATF